MKDYFVRYGLSSLIPTLTKLEQSYTNPVKRTWLQNRLCAQLNKTKGESLWRKLNEEISYSQQGYPTKIEYYNCPEWQAVREQITEQLQDEGFEGTYPDFYKSGSMKGIHLESSYGMSYFVGMERRAVFRIHCYELVHLGSLQVEFLCGTAFLKKGETAEDIHSCLFDAAGRRLCKGVYYHHDAEEYDADGQPVKEDLSAIVTIAAKRAQCQKLTKAERKAYYGESNWKAYVWLGLVMGGLFAVAMTLTAIIICCLATAMTVGFGEIPAMLREMPWLLLFAIAFFGFGISMAIAEYMADRK